MSWACDHAQCPATYCDHKACTSACTVCAVPVAETTSMFWRGRPRPPQTPCPYCGAGAGEPCVTRGRHSHKLADLHPSRSEAA